MRSSIIARNYAETLLTLAQRDGGDAAIDEFGEALDQLTEMLRAEPRVREFLESPVMDAERKKDAIRKTLQGRAPERFIRFLLVVIDKRRAAHLDAIAQQFQLLVDELRGRIRAEVVLAREPDAALRAEIAAALSAMTGREVVASFRIDDDLVGGIVVRVGDQMLDGSVRRRAAELRRRMLTVELPSLASA